MADAGVPCTVYLPNGRQSLTDGHGLRTGHSPVEHQIPTDHTMKNERLGVFPGSLVAACLIVGGSQCFVKA